MSLDVSAPSSLIDEVRRIGARARAATGAADVRAFRRIHATSIGTQLAGRAALLLWAHAVLPGPGAWILGMGLVAFSLALEAQLNHTVQHGAFVGVPGAEALTPARWESLALPFRTATWREAHRIHHANPSMLARDPDTRHGLFQLPRAGGRLRRALVTAIGVLFVFEVWAFDYDRFLKEAGHRAPRDRGELGKLARFVGYQYALWALLGWPRAGWMMLAALCAIAARNLVFVGLQLASSVGERVSEAHATLAAAPRHDAWVHFQVETSKDFALHGVWRHLCGGLDRHIEHHLYPDLPPARLYEVAPQVRALCARAGIRYEEHPTVWRSLADSVRQVFRA